MSFAVLGGTSIIGLAVAKEFAKAGHNVLMVSRKTSVVDADIIRNETGAMSVSCLDADISMESSIQPIAKEIIQSFDEDPYVLIATGMLGVGPQTHLEIPILLELIDVNYRHLIAVVMLISRELEKREKGCIILLSSVAGDRGRQSNFVYGSAKAGMSTFAQGLRNCLFHSGVHVLTVKPGYVDTPMFHQALGPRAADSVPRFLVSDPNKAAQKIISAAIRRKNVVYVTRIWRLVMFLIRSIPEPIFKRLRL